MEKLNNTTLTLANNFLGLALGPLLVGRLSDVIGLHNAFQLMPLMSLAAAAVFFYAKRHYHRDMEHANQQTLIQNNSQKMEDQS